MALTHHVLMSATKGCGSSSGQYRKLGLVIRPDGKMPRQLRTTPKQTCLLAVDKIYCGKADWPKTYDTYIHVEAGTLRLRVVFCRFADASQWQKYRLGMPKRPLGMTLWQHFILLKLALQAEEDQKSRLQLAGRPVIEALDVVTNGHDADFWIKKIENFKDDKALERSIKRQQAKGLI